MTGRPSRTPVRTCVGCRHRAEQPALMRVVAGDHSDPARGWMLVPDPRRRQQLGLPVGVLRNLDPGAVLAAAPHRVLDRLHPLVQHPARLRVERLVLPCRAGEVPRVHEDVGRVDPIDRERERHLADMRIGELPAACRQLGMGAPLLVTDPGLAALPMIGKALAACRADGLQAAVFAAIKGNPTGQNIADGVAAFQAGGHDGVIAFARREFAVFPKARAGVSCAVDKVENGGPNGWIPERNLFVTASIDESLVLAIGDGIAIQ